MIEDIKQDARSRMGKSVESLKQELKKLRTGRAHVSLLDHITVEYYGSQVPLSQVSNVTAEDAPLAAVRVVSADYLEMMGVPLLAGRALSKDDDARAQPVALISAELAAGFGPPWASMSKV